ncbi:uncharacterized protein LOC128737575 [Sabethes cyaneus]|uniref:uncharacterized protein LOC128737575 n=1 Tax=Sabethes cyaneus TaxID=53552 RepID=UPI00221E30D6|nr:uncharacterized protein LOC128737575 [Sabethes cyaneus]XP_053688223.1 uncharacterized protein LOC128737575 [Sabethes cyaneus]
MLTETDQKNDEQVQKHKGIPMPIQQNIHFKSTTEYTDSLMASNYNKLQMQLNTRYISQICCPRRIRVSLPHVRMRPYFVPQRSRTKSENSDTSSLMNLETIPATDAVRPSLNCSLMMETCDPSFSQMDTSNQQHQQQMASMPEKRNTLVKSKSLENLAQAARSVDGSQPSHEMEFVSSRIQKLKVQE